MIRSNSKRYQLLDFTETSDSYGQTTSSYTPKAYVDVFISLISQSVIESDPRYLDVSYMGLTDYRGVKPGMRITGQGKSYDVKFINDRSRSNMIMALEEVIPNEEQ